MAMFGLGDIYIALEEAGDSSVEPVQLQLPVQESDPNTRSLFFVPQLQGRYVVSYIHPCVTGSCRWPRTL